MIEFPIVVTHRDSVWTIRFRGKFYDTFPCKADALNTAIRWAEHAERQGHAVTILLNEHGRVRALGRHEGSYPTS